MSYSVFQLNTYFTKYIQVYDTNGRKITPLKTNTTFSFRVLKQQELSENVE